MQWRVVICAMPDPKQKAIQLFSSWSFPCAFTVKTLFFFKKFHQLCLAHFIGNKQLCVSLVSNSTPSVDWWCSQNFQKNQWLQNQNIANDLNEWLLCEHWISHTMVPNLLLRVVYSEDIAISCMLLFLSQSKEWADACGLSSTQRAMVAKRCLGPSKIQTCFGSGPSWQKFWIQGHLLRPEKTEQGLRWMLLCRNQVVAIFGTQILWFAWN